MNILPVKALSCALLTATLLLSINLASAASTPKVVTETVKAAVTEQVVHLNKSTIDDLMTLKGIGQKKAEAILAYRQEIGDFKSIEDLAKVKGIGAKVLMDNKGRLKI